MIGCTDQSYNPGLNLACTGDGLFGGGGRAMCGNVKGAALDRLCKSLLTARRTCGYGRARVDCNNSAGRRDFDCGCLLLAVGGRFGLSIVMRICSFGAALAGAFSTMFVDSGGSITIGSVSALACGCVGLSSTFGVCAGASVP